jgi:AcrR family transcriptional regulator
MPRDADTTPRKRGRGADPEQTKADLIDAAITSLVEDGYRGTTARSIAARANCNQAAIYYHFGGIEPLLIDALAHSSSERLRRYQDSLRPDETLPQLVQRLEGLYREDRDSGHMALLTELVGGITASPELRDGIERATEPWLAFVEEQIRSASASLPFGSLLPATDLADLVFSVIIGVELRNKVDGNHDRSDRLFQLGGLLATLVQSQADSADPQ